MQQDTIGRFDEVLPGEPLLQPVMRAGTRLRDGMVSLDTIRCTAVQHRELLPPELRRLEAQSPYAVVFSSGLEKDRDRLLQSLNQ
jgi:nicotinate phosphoribosyltransferase